MIKYVLTPNGAINRETEMTIKALPASIHWQEYLVWVNEGNTPVPMSPGEGYVLIGDEWVLDQSIIDIRILGEKKTALKAKLLELFEFIFALFTVLKSKGIISNADFDLELITKAQAWKQLLDDIDDLS